eukprot:11666372-Alexandrium_andersonii.AAC.1
MGSRPPPRIPPPGAWLLHLGLHLGVLLARGREGTPGARGVGNHPPERGLAHVLRALLRGLGGRWRRPQGAL